MNNRQTHSPSEPRWLILAPIASEYVLARRLLTETRRVGKVHRAVSGHFGGVPAILVQIGMGIQSATRATRWALDQFAPRRALLYGFAGGLDPRWSVGSVVWANALLRADRETIAAAGRPAGMLDPLAPLLTVDSLVTSPEDKARLGDRSGAAAVDMESWVVAELCQAAQVPLYVLRAISDARDDALDPGLLGIVGTDGSVSFRAAAAAVARNPMVLRAFAKSLRDSRRAARSLTDVLARLADIAERARL